MPASVHAIGNKVEKIKRDVAGDKDQMTERFIYYLIYRYYYLNYRY